MTPDNFRVAFQPYADQAAAGTGLSADLFLAQWAVETGYASSFAGWYNLGNITRGGASNGFVNYTSYAQFTNAEILLLHDIPYEGVLASAGKSLADQCVALGASPWDAGHYNNGGGPGSSLIAVLPAFGLSADQISGGVLMTITSGQQADFDALVAANPILSGLKGGVQSVYGEEQNLAGGIQSVVAAIADLKAHPAVVSDPSVLPIVERIEAALKLA